jgi:hypothetical protein
MIKCLEETMNLLESKGQIESGTDFVSVQQPLGEISHFLWDLRRGRVKKLWVLALLFEGNGPLSRLADNNGWSEDFVGLKRRFDEAFSEMNCIRYNNSEEPVKLGDHVRFRVLLVRRTGRVTYVPGQSDPNAEIDFGGLFRIGIDVPNGPFVAIHVDPETLLVKRGVVLIRRDSESIPSLPTNEELRR